MTKSTKSQQGGLAPSSFRTSGGVHELVAGSSAWRVRAARDKAKVDSFALSAILYYTTRANIAHEEAEQIRAHIVCTHAINAGRAWGILCADESKDFRQPSPVGEGVSHRLTDEVSFKKRLKILFLCRAFGHSKARETKSFFVFLFLVAETGRDSRRRIESPRYISFPAPFCRSVSDKKVKNVLKNLPIYGII